jgi:trans-2-enoyl-CoA reductase
MQKISIQTNIGSCAITVGAEINAAEILKSMQMFGEFLIWHNAASATYSGGKKAKFKRDDKFSDELGEKACESVVSVLEKHGFVNVSCEASAHTKLDDKGKFVRDMIKLGLSAEAAEAGWNTAQEKMQAKQPSTEEAVEVVVS